MEHEERGLFNKLELEFSLNNYSFLGLLRMDVEVQTAPFSVFYMTMKRLLIGQ